MKPPSFLLWAVGGLGLFGAGIALRHFTTPDPTGPSSPAAIFGKAQTQSRDRINASVAERLTSRLQGILNGGHSLTTREWNQLVAELEPEDVPALLPLVEQLPVPLDRLQLLCQLTQLWATEHPQEALAWAGQRATRGRFFEKEQVIAAVLGGWARNDPAAAAAHLVQSPGRGFYAPRYAAQSLIEAWCESDSAAAFAWAKNLPAGVLCNSALDALVTNLPMNAPAVALDLALSLNAGRQRDYLLSSILSQQAFDDPGTALQTIRSLPASIDRGPLFQGVVAALAAEDPKLAGEFALTLPEGKALTDALRLTLDVMVDRDPVEALSWLDNSLPNGPTRSTVLHATLMSLSASNPSAAIPYIEQLSGMGRTNLVRNIARNWAWQDAPAAAAWAAQLPAEFDRMGALETALRTWTHTDLNGAITYAQSLPDPADLRQTLKSIASTSSGLSLTEARAILAQLTSNAARESFTVGLIEERARESPTDAIALLETLAAGPARSNTVRTLVFNWALSDLPSAAAWARSVTDPATHFQATAEVVRLWVSRDNAAAAQWIASLPADNVRDYAAARYIEVAGSKNLSAAASLTASISAPELRQKAITALAQYWLTQDRSDAIEWLTRTDLPEAAKQKLLAPGP